MLEMKIFLRPFLTRMFNDPLARLYLGYAYYKSKAYRDCEQELSDLIMFLKMLSRGSSIWVEI